MNIDNIFTMNKRQQERKVYNVNTDLKQGFLDATKNGQVRMALEYLAFMVENITEEFAKEESVEATVPEEAPKTARRKPQEATAEAAE